MRVCPDGFLIFDSPSLAERTSIRLGGEAIAEVRITDLAALDRIPVLLPRLGGRLCVMGEGSNIIARQGKLALLLLSISPVEEPRVIEDNGKRIRLQAPAGMRLPALLARAAGLGLSGLESLCGIPGSIGGAVAMNAGSFGTETAPLVDSVQLFSPDWGLVERTAKDLDFGYRSFTPRGHSGWFLITAVTLKLTRGNKDAIRERMREVFASKRQNQPVTAWSAGCVFKNPAKDAPAGRLLEEAGFRGKKEGGMAFSPVHANFLVNEGHGTSEQAIELIEKAKDAVRARTGHELELEVRLWP